MTLTLAPAWMILKCPWIFWKYYNSNSDTFSDLSQGYHKALFDLEPRSRSYLHIFALQNKDEILDNHIHYSNWQNSLTFSCKLIKTSNCPRRVDLYIFMCWIPENVKYDLLTPNQCHILFFSIECHGKSRNTVISVMLCFVEKI